jgi:hypothetical protein
MPGRWDNCFVRGKVMNYKALGAILTLKEFDAKELARFSRLEESTVYTIIRRHGEFFQKIGKKGTGKRGGKLVRYRLKPDRIAELEKVRADLSARLNIRKMAEPAGITSDLIPRLSAGIRSAERIFLDRFPEASPEDKIHLLELAKVDVPEDAKIIEDAPPFLRAHLQLLLALKELCVAELHSDKGSEYAHVADHAAVDAVEEQRAAERFTELCYRLETTANALSAVGDHKKAAAVRKRLAQSPLNPIPTPPAEEPSSAGAFPEFVHIGDAPVLSPLVGEPVGAPLYVVPAPEVAQVPIIPPAAEVGGQDSYVDRPNYDAAAVWSPPQAVAGSPVMLIPVVSKGAGSGPFARSGVTKWYARAAPSPYPFSSWEQHSRLMLKPENQAIIYIVERISAITNPVERMVEAVRAARKQYELKGGAASEKLDSLLKQIDKGQNLPLDNSNLPLLALLPAFYCQKLMRTSRGHFLHVNHFLSALENWTHQKEIGKTSSAERLRSDQEAEFTRLYEYAGS